jgi:hypothetical protein
VWILGEIFYKNYYVIHDAEKDLIKISPHNWSQAQVYDEGSGSALSSDTDSSELNLSVYGIRFHMFIIILLSSAQIILS